MRNEVINFISDHYEIEPEKIFEKYPQISVFRHKISAKWFGVLISVEGEKIGLKNGVKFWVLNLKCRPDLAMILIDNKQILNAYHMNKKHWISVNLDSGIEFQKVCDLIDESFKLTKQGKRSGKF